MTCVEAILMIWLALPHCWADRGETEQQRLALYRPVAVAICAATTSPARRAFLARQTYDETRLCKYVLEDRCSDGPEGQRCDGGLATGPFQVHAWCRKAWAAHRRQTRRLISAARLHAGARCALWLADSGLKRCGTWHGAFAFQRKFGRCSDPAIAQRVPAHQKLLSRFKRLLKQGLKMSRAEEEDR